MIRNYKAGAIAAMFAVLVPVSVFGQTVRVLSEFKRVDPFGEIVPQDRPGLAREILSPALPRNAYSSFRVIAEPPPGVPYWMYIGINPENAVRANLYKEVWEKQGENWVPDRLEPLKLPYNGLVPQSNISGQTAETFLLDLWVDGGAPVRRIRVEAQMWIPDRWIIYPMEMRIVETKAKPLIRPRGGSVEPVGSPSNATALTVWRSSLCGTPEPPPTATPPGQSTPVPAWTIRSVILRNARQDLTIAPGTPEELLAIAGIADKTRFCDGQNPGGDQAGPEMYLSLRDRLVRGK